MASSATTGMYTSLYWGVQVQFLDELEEYMVRSLKVTKGVIRSIFDFIAVDAYMERLFLVK